MVDEVKQPAKRGHYRLSDRMLLALQSLAEGRAESVAKAAQLAGLTERSIYYSLKKEPAKEWLRAHIATALQLGQIPAMKTMLSLLRSSNEMSKYRSAAWLMQANGVGPVETRSPLVNIAIGAPAAGWVIDLSEPDVARLGASGATALLVKAKPIEQRRNRAKPRSPSS